MSRYRFAVVGDNCVDRFQLPVGQSLIGGNAINVAVQLAMLGHAVFYFGAVGRDADGARTRDLLAEMDVRVDHLQMLDGETAYTNIDITETGDRIFAHEDFGVCQNYLPSEDDFAALAGMDHVHIGWIADRGLVRRRMAEAGTSVSQDVSVNNDQMHLGVDSLRIAFGSAGENREKADAMMKVFLDSGAKLAVVTRGGEGSAATDGTVLAETGILAVDVADTTGAGDSFIAGFLHAYIAGGSLETSLVSGRECAARTCGHVGGFPQKPQPL
ncbi:fructoselysine 6-kinase [Pararhizobium capsulatum DSM 1112]|uniref:Fructoselysine 6-kinase n=1 Tax=Pararhizobium capsulatum DSM 1112 TaxID=1121113 RepID=A0ABU0BW32_9HYPH|nr:PfkB family carbohydrate kinase [Pararhizobium capsulatum]MDQ0322466.1 fructoselysine 6-kinase [Pararhizobium capsulatum DSM 1112]